jgi:exonuclease VII large subunit
MRNVTECLRQWRQSLDACMRSVVFRDPRHRLRTQVQHIDELSHRLRAGARQRLSLGARRLEPAANRLMALHPARLREMAARRLDALVNRLRWVLGGRSKKAGDAMAKLQSRLMAAHPQNRLAMASQRLDAVGKHLEALGYRSILQRGFSVTKLEFGKIVRSVSEVASGAVIQTEVADGHFKSRVTDGSPQDETNSPNSKLEPTTVLKPEQKSKPEPKARPKKVTDRDDDLLLFD